MTNRSNDIYSLYKTFKEKCVSSIHQFKQEYFRIKIEKRDL